MENVIQNRSEILFLYDVKDGNPNGDPVDENKPRIDEETNENIVTDVRLKRTIRDYLYEYKNQEIFIREIRKEDSKLVTKEERMNQLGKDSIINKCIDIRLFGSTTAVENQTLALTGPVQFKFGRSLHKVDLTYIKGTTVMPSGQEKKQGTFTERYILPYSLIAFYGIVNENAAKMQNIPLTNNDIDLMMEGIWNGTKNLISGTKFGQMPRLLMQVIYKENQNFFIGELDKYISIQSDLQDEALRDISDLKIDITKLVNVLKNHQDKIESIKYKVDERVNFVLDGKDITLSEALKDLPLKEFVF
jgi:CRISPR-associated protein Csh2